MILTVADTNLDRTEFCTVGTGVLDGPSVTGVLDVRL